MWLTELTILNNITNDQELGNQEIKNQNQFRDMHLFKNSVLSQEDSKGLSKAETGSHTSSMRRMMTTEELEYMRIQKVSDYIVNSQQKKRLAYTTKVPSVYTPVTSTEKYHSPFSHSNRVAHTASVQYSAGGTNPNSLLF